MKKALFLILLFTSSLAASAQLKVTSDGKVKIASNLTNSHSTLTVGNNQFIWSSGNAGITGSTTATESKNNIGIVGTIYANSNFSNDTNYGVLGVVGSVNTTHGRNYGLSGMIDFNGPHYGGTGIYGTNYAYFYYTPTNIQGDYAENRCKGVKPELSLMVVIHLQGLELHIRQYVVERVNHPRTKHL